MDRITCDIIRDLLPLYIDEVCSAGSRALVEGHLQNCPACKAEYETISKREFFYDARERKVLDRLSKRWKQSRRKMLFVGAAAALLAALLIGLIAFGCSMKVIPAEEIAVSSLSRLGNGDLASSFNRRMEKQAFVSSATMRWMGSSISPLPQPAFHFFQHQRVRKVVGSFIQGIPAFSRLFIKGKGRNCLSGMRMRRWSLLIHKPSGVLRGWRSWRISALMRF